MPKKKIEYVTDGPESGGTANPERVASSVNRTASGLVFGDEQSALLRKMELQLDDVLEAKQKLQEWVDDLSVERNDLQVQLEKMTTDRDEVQDDAEDFAVQIEELKGALYDTSILLFRTAVQLAETEIELEESHKYEDLAHSGFARVMGERDDLHEEINRLQKTVAALTTENSHANDLAELRKNQFGVLKGMHDKQTERVVELLRQARPWYKKVADFFSGTGQVDY